jgi:tetratricopeptide (TPR) repeat protein
MRLVGSVAGCTVAKLSPKNEKNRPARSSPIRKSQSLPARATAPSILQINKSSIGTLRKGPSPEIAISSIDDEISKILTGAKPSEIRAAARASKADRERQRRLLQNQQQGQLKMDKIRAEIEAIKAKEEAMRQQVKAATDEVRITSSPLRACWEQAPDLDSSMEDILASMKDGKNDRSDLKEHGRKLMEEMQSSFAGFGGTEAPSNSSDCESFTDREHRKPKEDNIEGFSMQGHQRIQGIYRHTRKPSNLVPEMRRRASQHDLLFDDELHISSRVLQPTSTQSPAKGGEVTENPEALLSVDQKAKSEHMSSSFSSSDKHADHAPSMPVKSPKANESSGNVTTSPKSGKKTLAKMEEEKLKIVEQKKQLEDAKRYFEEGHDLCWKMQDSVGGLGGYRKALFTRESLLGKYHDETGRTYYWIGRSLVKLKEYDEALVAFSRAYRIFDRVLSKNHKYRKWAETAIASCFREMDDKGRFCEDYQRNLDESITHERAGDAHRKLGKLDDGM